MSYTNPPERRPIIAGLCADLAEEFSLAPSLVRMIVLVCAVLPTGVTYMLLGWLAERRNPAALRRGAAGAAAAPSAALAPVVRRLRALDARLSNMEAFVTSRDFELHKGFRNIGR